MPWHHSRVYQKGDARAHTGSNVRSLSIYLSPSTHVMLLTPTTSHRYDTSLGFYIRGHPVSLTIWCSRSRTNHCLTMHKNVSTPLVLYFVMHAHLLHGAGNSLVAVVKTSALAMGKAHSRVLHKWSRTQLLISFGLRPWSDQEVDLVTHNHSVILQWLVPPTSVYR